MKRAPKGYNGKILRVNLSNKSVTAEQIDEKFCRRYIGGAGFVAYYLWKELKKGIDALSPDNKLIFALGPVSGVKLPGAARHCVGGKSPLTSGLAKSESGGFWGAQLKRAGYDAIIVEGKSDKPVYIWINDGKAVIKDASHLWGKETKEAESAIRSDLDDEKVHVASIGPAGENLVRYACIMHGLHDAAGRGGLGAVMGSKRLKAIAVRGHRLPKIADNERLKEVRKMIYRPSRLSEFGTGGPEMEMFEEPSGNLPVRNFRDGLFPGVSKIHAGVMKKESMWVGMEGCYACPVRCKKVIQLEEPYKVDAAYGGPEYETLAALGSNCGIDNLKAIIKGNELCNAYSMDTISTGGTIAFAMECFEKGLLSEKDTGGIDLRFGNDVAMLEVIELIARRKGIGNLLAEGTARIANKIGKGSADFAINVKGLEAGMHDPRTKTGLGLGYMVNPHGADHCCNIMDVFYSVDAMMKPMHPLGMLEPVDVMDIGPRKVELFKLAHCKAILEDALSVCLFLGYSMENEAAVLAAITGWDTGIAELVRVGERILTLTRLFNLREGFTIADDEMPKRFYQPKTNGPLTDVRLDPGKYSKARNYYYALMGWDPEGVPLPERVKGLYIE